MTCYIPRWFTHPQTVTYPSTNQTQCRLTSLIEDNVLTTTLRRHLLIYHRHRKRLSSTTKIVMICANRATASETGFTTVWSAVLGVLLGRPLSVLCIRMPHTSQIWICPSLTRRPIGLSSIHTYIASGTQLSHTVLCRQRWTYQKLFNRKNHDTASQ